MGTCVTELYVPLKDQSDWEDFALCTLDSGDRWGWTPPTISQNRNPLKRRYQSKNASCKTVKRPIPKRENVIFCSKTDIFSASNHSENLRQESAKSVFHCIRWTRFGQALWKSHEIPLCIRLWISPQDRTPILTISYLNHLARKFWHFFYFLQAQMSTFWVKKSLSPALVSPV